MGKPKEGHSPPTWKLVIVQWCGLFPVLVAISYFTKWLGVKPTILKLFCESIILVPLLAYIITPFLDTVFSEWLYKGVDEEAQEQSL